MDLEEETGCKRGSSSIAGAGARGGRGRVCSKVEEGGGAFLRDG
ncbi:hypothetical protein A2U01_0093707 [Trifolium medium]|uniref:Uncharacterized protein n=1 Tax=Trifolium medium TaxID=97028 RepID=A0A392UIJ0_9FABA|nr:hypothetical protein [Trifolium medium]